MLRQGTLERKWHSQARLQLLVFCFLAFLTMCNPFLLSRVCLWQAGALNAGGSGGIFCPAVVVLLEGWSGKPMAASLWLSTH